MRRTLSGMDDIPESPPTPGWQRVGRALTMIGLVVSAVLLSGSSWEILAYAAVIVALLLLARLAKRQRTDSRRRRTSR